MSTSYHFYLLSTDLLDLSQLRLNSPQRRFALEQLGGGFVAHLSGQRVTQPIQSAEEIKMEMNGVNTTHSRPVSLTSAIVVDFVAELSPTHPAPSACPADLSTIDRSTPAATSTPQS